MKYIEISWNVKQKYKKGRRDTLACTSSRYTYVCSYVKVPIIRTSYFFSSTFVEIKVSPHSYIGATGGICEQGLFRNAHVPHLFEINPSHSQACPEASTNMASGVPWLLRQYVIHKRTTHIYIVWRIAMALIATRWDHIWPWLKLKWYNWEISWYSILDTLFRFFYLGIESWHTRTCFTQLYNIVGKSPKCTFNLTLRRPHLCITSDAMRI